MNTTAAHASVRPMDLPATAARTQESAVRAVNLRTTWMILRATFSIVPVVAGLDKFVNLLTNWESYLNPTVARLLPLNPHAFMQVAGVIEIAAGLLVFFRPRLGALVVAAWLTCIALSLIASGQYLDVAVRDLVMAVGAFTLARLTSSVETHQ